MGVYLFFGTITVCIAIVIYIELNAAREQAKLHDRIGRDAEIIRALRAELYEANRIIGHGAGVHVMGLHVTDSHRNKGQSK